MENFKLGEFSINLKDKSLDNSQYIIMMILEKFNLNINEKTLAQTSKTFLKKLIHEEYGISIGKLNNVYGEFEFYINGIPQIYTSDGKMISSSSEFKKYLIGELNIDDLHFETKAYIQVLNHTHPENYYGIFYSLNDAIKICSENDLVKTGEITS